MNVFPLQIATPDGLLYDGNAESLLVRTVNGDVEIMAGHADYIAAVGCGRVRLQENGSVRFAAASGGFLSVCGGHVRLVCTTFEFADQIDLARAVAAKARAEEAIRAHQDGVDERVVKAKLSRALARIQVKQG